MKNENKHKNSQEKCALYVELLLIKIGGEGFVFKRTSRIEQNVFP